MLDHTITGKIGAGIKVIQDPSQMREVQLELTAMCNADCPFCINRASFAMNGRHTNGLDTETLVRVIDWIADSGVNRVRFTGGEPMLRKDLFALATHAKTRELTTVLNTNGLLVAERRDLVYELFDVVLLSIISSRPERTNSIMRTGRAHRIKLKALEALKDHPNLWTDSVLSDVLVEEMEEIHRMLIEYNVDYWFLLRPEPNGFSVDSYTASSELIAAAVRKLKLLDQISTGLRIGIGNAIPCCAISDTAYLTELLHRSDGGHTAEGRSKLIVDPYGKILVDRGINIPIGHIFDDISTLWSNDFARKIRGTEYMPAVCQRCPLVPICHGGSRMAAQEAYSSFAAPDPLMNVSNISAASFAL